MRAFILVLCLVFSPVAATANYGEVSVDKLYAEAEPLSIMVGDRVLFSANEIIYDFNSKEFIVFQEGMEDAWTGPLREVVIDTPYGLISGNKGKLVIRQGDTVYNINAKTPTILISNETMKGWGLAPLPGRAAM